MKTTKLILRFYFAFKAPKIPLDTHQGLLAIPDPLSLKTFHVP